LNDARDKIEKDLRNEYNNYDQTVDVVSCWQSISEFVLKADHFYRFGKFRDESENDLTPDFAVAWSDGAADASAGSIMCDIKKLPNPYPENATDEEVVRAGRNFGFKVEEVFKYAKTLAYVSDHFGLPKLTFSQHDVVLLTPNEVSSSACNYLKEKLPSRPFNIGRPLVLIEYSYNEADQLQRYVFTWKQGEANSPFSNPLLNDRMVIKGQPLLAYPKHFMPYKIRHITCNDPVPSIYLIVFLWVEVFIKFLTDEQFEVWGLTSTSTAVELVLRPSDVLKKIREEYATDLSIHDIRRVFRDLVRIKKAVLKEAASETYIISFANLSGRYLREDSGQEGLDKKEKLKEYGRLFATLLAEKDLKAAATPRALRLRGGKPRIDHPWLNFGDK
jgi:hypothetical protein